MLVLLVSLMVSAQTEWREQEIKQLDFCYDYSKVRVETDVGSESYKVQGCTFNGNWWDCECDQKDKQLNLLYLPGTKGIFNYKVEYNVQPLVNDDPASNALAKRNINIENQRVGYITFDPVVNTPSDAPDSNTLLIILVIVLAVAALIIGGGIWYMKKLWSESDDA